MQLRIPWIVSRKRLVIAVVADGALFVFLYYVLYQFNFSVWPGFSPRLAVLLAIWSLVSYVIGRYFGGPEGVQDRPAWNILGKQLIGTGFVLLLTLGVTILHIWLFNRNPVQASFRSFLIPFLGSLSILSPLLQLALRRLLVLQDLDRKSAWSYVGTRAGYQQLQNMLQWSRVRVRVEHVLPHQLGQTPSSHFVIDSFHDQPLLLLKRLYRFQQQGYAVLSRLSWCEVVLQRFPSELLSDADFLDGCFSVPNGTLQSRLKRVADVIVASALLVVTSPLILISAILIKLSDRGPVFYSQIRTGLNGKPFRIWKLRSMRTDAENLGPKWSSRSDPRITKIGSMLRRTRLDELPQLYCVLTGSMSLIGPRPERPEFNHQLSEKIPYYDLRHLIRPGLSGWAQVNYPYGASIGDSANKLSYDLFYLKNFSFLLDLLILLKTIRLVFNAQGALPEMTSCSSPIS